MHLFKVRSYIILLIDENIYIVDDINIYTKSKPAWRPWNSRTNIAKGFDQVTIYVALFLVVIVTLSLSRSQRSVFFPSQNYYFDDVYIGYITFEIKLIIPIEYKLKWWIIVPVSPLSMQFHNQELFLSCNITSSNVRSQIVQPSEPATLSGSFKT